MVGLLSVAYVVLCYGLIPTLGWLFAYGEGSQEQVQWNWATPNSWLPYSPCSLCTLPGHDHGDYSPLDGRSAWLSPEELYMTTLVAFLLTSIILFLYICSHTSVLSTCITVYFSLSHSHTMDCSRVGNETEPKQWQYWPIPATRLLPTPCQKWLLQILTAYLGL